MQICGKVPGMPGMPKALGSICSTVKSGWRQEEQKFKVILSYISEFGDSLRYMKYHLKKKPWVGETVSS